MTTLADPMVADIARKAGFVQPALPVAIACALAASGAIPAFDHPIWPGPIAHYRGLWGVDTVEWPDSAGADLANPYVAAAWARAHTQAAGGFGWCPTYRSGAYLPYMARGRVASGMLPGLGHDTTPVASEIHRRSTEMDLRALSATVAAVTAHHYRGR